MVHIADEFPKNQPKVTNIHWHTLYTRHLCQTTTAQQTAYKIALTTRHWKREQKIHAPYIQRNPQIAKHTHLEIRIAGITFQRKIKTIMFSQQNKRHNSTDSDLPAIMQYYQSRTTDHEGTHANDQSPSILVQTSARRPHLVMLNKFKNQIL